MIRSSKFAPAFFFALLALGTATTATAQQPGISDTEIKFGNIMPYSGPASALSVTGKTLRPISTWSTRKAASTDASST